MQIAQYINIISITSPQIFDTIYSKADLMSNVNLNFTFIKNPFKKFAQCSKFREGSLSKMDTPSFMFNTGNQLFIWALLAFLYGVSLFMLKHVPLKCKKVRAFFKGLYDSYFYSLPIETFNEIFMTIIFYAFVNLFQIIKKCYTYYIDLSTAAIFLTLCGAYYFWINAHIPVGSKEISKEYEDKYGALIRDVPLKKGYFAIKLICVSLSFKIAYALSLAALIELPLIQVCLAIFLNGAYLLYLAIVRPYSTVKLNYINIFNYFCLEVLLILKLCTLYLLNESNEMKYGYVMAALFLLPILQSLVIFGVDYYFALLKSLYQKIAIWVRTCKAKRAKNYKARRM